MKIQTQHQPLSLRQLTASNNLIPLELIPSCNRLGHSSESTREECIELLSRVEYLEKKLTKLQKKLRRSEQNERIRKKRRRRNSELSKRYKCLNPNCDLAYDSMTSLKYHMKIKHQTKIKKKRHQDIIIQIL